MTSAIKVRLTSFALAIGLVTALIAWATYTIWKEVANLQGVDLAQIETYKVADQLQSTILHLNKLLGDYALKPDEATLQRFWQDSDKLNRWIDDQKRPRLPLSESTVIGQIDIGYDSYLDTATNVVAELRSNHDPKTHLEAIGKINEASARMFGRGSDLEDAHRLELEKKLDATGKAIAMLQPLLVISLVVLLGLGTLLFVMIYRDMIAPLRVKLVESSVIIERQEKLASLGMLAAGVAHEIRNPLTAIKARLFMQAKQLKAGTSEHANAEIIGQEINRLERIVRDFLLFARPSEPELLIVPADQPLREAQELLGAQLQRSNIKIQLEDSADAWIKIDPPQIKQVIINLVQNAAESIGQNGVISLRTRCDHKVVGGRNAPVAVLEVADTGKGISPEVQKRLFDPFFTTKETGTGLGLPIAARIVEKHGGILQYQTQVNHGTTFGIVLPLAERP